VSLDVCVCEVEDGKEVGFSGPFYEGVGERAFVEQLKCLFSLKRKGVRVCFNLMYMGEAIGDAEMVEGHYVTAPCGVFQRVLDVLWPLMGELDQWGYVVEARSGEVVFRLGELGLEKDAWMGKLRGARGGPSKLE
jgi:hypothetical protein